EQMHIFADRETEHTDQRRFHSGEIHFAVAHREVPVANIQQSLRALYRNKHRRAGDELLIVHVARVIPGRRTVNASGRRRHANAAEKRPGWKMDARRELHHFSGEIEFDQLLPRVRELVTEQSIRGPEVIKAVRGARLDVHKINLQDVARSGAFHTDWSKQDMWSGPTIFDFGVDGPQLADIIVLGSVEARKSIGVSAYGFDANGLAGFDRNHRFGVGVIPPPLDIGGDGLQHL